VTDPDVLKLPLRDARARQEIARDLDANLLVEAGAGSGKTTQLVDRMVALLWSGTGDIEHIAAVTFTRKAAGELRERFQLQVEQRLAGARAEGRGDGLEAERLATALDNIDRAFIGTIHAFCARLLRERPLEVGLDPAFEEMPVEERIVQRRRFWHAYLERLARDSDPILEELAQAGLRPLSLYGLFEHVVENPDVFFEAEASDPPPAAEAAAVRAELEALVDHAWELMPDRQPEKDWDSLQKKIRTIRFTREITGWETQADFYDALDLLCKPGPRGHSVTQNRWKNGPLAKGVKERADAFGVGDTSARRLVGRWLAHRYALAIRLVEHAAREFEAHRLRMGQLDFQDLLLLTAKLLRDNPRVRRDLGERYRRLLVDEFQDTDPLQAEIVLLLSSEPPSQVGEGDEAAAPPDWRQVVPRPGALFVVGDPKQSIYRFRRADIQLYGVVKNRFRDFGRVLELTTNFRSRPAIGDLVNELFDGPDFFPGEETPEQAAFEPLNTLPPTEPLAVEGVFTYLLTPAQANQASAAVDDAARLATWIRRRVDSGERQPGDFMILTRNRARLDTYARALEAHSLPVQVTGAGVGVEEELRELQTLLECLVDPSNPVLVVAALVGLFFGIDYERLVAHRLEGGGFDAMRPGDRGHPDVLEGLRRLHHWWRVANDQPADIVVAALASELGLLPYAAAGELGSLRAGALVYALDAVRTAATAGEASLPGTLAALGAALDLAEAEAPLEPGRPDVVRLMNLHQAKGLEARVVVLADPSGAKRRAPDMHVVRSAEGRAVGYLRVTEASEGFGSDRALAMPVGWEEKAEAEERFEAAEEVRLLYVAVTRAKEELLVARWREGPDTSPWRALHPWLDERATPLELEPEEPEPRARVETTAEDVLERSGAAAASLADLRTPTYTHWSVTELAKGRDADVEQPSARRLQTGVDRGGFRGFSWGSAVHGALAAAAVDPDPVALRAACRDLLVQNERPLDDHGEPGELTELVELVSAVKGSRLWTRARRAERMLSEVPFAVPGVRVGDVEDASARSGGGVRPQLDLFGELRPADQLAGDDAEREVSGRLPTQILEGVIDLAFLEGDGWVIADYKTDVGTDPDFARRRQTYRRQVDLYAEAWTRLTGDPVKERVLFFTAQGREERW
jgi:ATP-dependent helicase/nuclease subunit A